LGRLGTSGWGWWLGIGPPLAIPVVILPFVWWYWSISNCLQMVFEVVGKSQLITSCVVLNCIAARYCLWFHLSWVATKQQILPRASSCRDPIKMVMKTHTDRQTHMHYIHRRQMLTSTRKSLAFNAGNFWSFSAKGSQDLAISSAILSLSS